MKLIAVHGLVNWWLMRLIGYDVGWNNGFTAKTQGVIRLKPAARAHVSINLSKDIGDKMALIRNMEFYDTIYLELLKSYETS